MSAPKNLVISIECGEKTCANESGKVCCNLSNMRFGPAPSCTIWPGSDLEEKDGWLQRCPECLKAEKEFQGIIEDVEESGFDAGCHVRPLNGLANEEEDN